MRNPAVEFERGEDVARSAATDRTRLLSIAAWAFAAGVVVFLLVAGVRNANETQKELRLIPYLEYDDRVDFAYFFAAANMVWRGDLAQLYPEKYEFIFYSGDPAFKQASDEYLQARMLARGNYYNPPLVAILQAPLASMSFKAAFWTFSFISGAAFLVFAGLSWRAGRAIPEMPVVILGFLAFRPVHEAIIMGHLSLFLAFALGVGFLALRAKQPLLAGIVLSLLAVKPQWAILPALFLFWRREWRALATMSAGAAAIILLPFIPAGLDTLKHYVQFLRDQSDTDIGNAPHMFSWNGFLSKLAPEDPYAIPEPDVNMTLLYTLQALTLLAVLVVWWGKDLYLGVAATIIGMLLVSTHSVWYDWAFLVVAALFLVLRPASIGVRGQVWFILLALFITSAQSVSVVFASDGRHGFLHWSEAGFFSVTLAAFGVLLWCAGRTVLEGRIKLRRLASAPVTAA